MLAYDPTTLNYLVQAGDLTRLVFGKVASESAVSGWALSKMLNRSPDDIEPVLAELRDKQLLDSDRQGLEGMYHLTQLGYLSRSFL